MNICSPVRKVAFVGNHFPRKCGIATFTADLVSAVGGEYPETRCIAVPVNDPRQSYDYPDVVQFEIEEQDHSSYRRAADYLNFKDPDIVCLQHEFGIFGGVAGRHVLTLLRELRMPVVTTLHTILREPSAEQRHVMDSLISHSTRLVTMTERGRAMLLEIYGAPSDKIDLIPHGIPDGAFVDPTFFKEQLNLEGRSVMLTFGLLAPSKGIEHVLNAMPRIVEEVPNLVYVVLGATHPNELREHGESYRLGLERLARKNKVGRHVRFQNQFVDLKTLQAFIGAADLYITPYMNEAQVTSGALAYAFGAGKAVVSTPYWHAAELLAEGRGVLVPFGDSDAIANEALDLFKDDRRRNAIRNNAYRIGRQMIWSCAAQSYMRSFERSRSEVIGRSRPVLTARTINKPPRELPKLKLNHLLRMTDSSGVFQHAAFSVPKFSEGQCTDDNARAFVLAILLCELGMDSEPVHALATTSAAFLHHAFNTGAKRFHNHLSFDRRWIDEWGSEDSQGRAIWALGTAVGRSRLESFQMLGGQLFSMALPPLVDFTSPRAWAFGLIGIHEYLRRLNGDSAVNQVRDTLTNRLMERFVASSNPDWQWFEAELSYDNAKLAHALISTGDAMGERPVMECGLLALRWLVAQQTAEAGHFRPIGSNGFYRRGGVRARFDQQPIEAHATVSACLEAYRITSDKRWYDSAKSAFDWFLGSNDLGLELYSPETGGCRDGLHVDRVNQNQGAESTLAFLLSLAEMQLAQDSHEIFAEPPILALERPSPEADPEEVLS